ncbi:MAG: putative peptidoglycan-binding domain-containing protein, partial [Bacteroidales bacterium]|nr:putative peptidoglycan-binding domain-containing protein [Bacteroidales bacterium]
VGPKTIEALNGVPDYKQFFDEVKVQREKFFDDIVRRDPSQKRFIKGWKRRLGNIGWGSLKYSNNKVVEFSEAGKPGADVPHIYKCHLK